MILTRDNEYFVVLDACVLAPMPLCDTLLRCAEEPALYRALWSYETLDEIRRTLRKFGRSEAQAERRISAMHEAFPEACVRVPASLLEAITELPDANDRHVVAAAIHGHAYSIITLNLRDFPDKALEPHGILAHSPDDFLVHQFHLNPDRIREVLDIQASGIRQSRSAVLDRLHLLAPNFVELIR